MQVNLNSNELKMIEDALDAWERESSGNAMMSGMLGMMLTPKDERDGVMNKFEQEMKTAGEDLRNRKIRATLLRAKLYGAMAVESERVVES